MIDSALKTPYSNPHLKSSLSMPRRKMVTLSVLEVVTGLGHQSPCLSHLASALDTFWGIAIAHSYEQAHVPNSEWRDLAYSLSAGNDGLRDCTTDIETLESYVLDVTARLLDLYHDGLHERSWAPKMALIIDKLAETLNWAREQNLVGPVFIHEEYILLLLNQQISMGLVGPFMSHYVELKAANTIAA